MLRKYFEGKLDVIELSETEQMVFHEMVRRADSGSLDIAARELEDPTGRAVYTIRRALRSLTDKGLLQKIGKTSYEVPPEVPALIEEGPLRASTQESERLGAPKGGSGGSSGATGTETGVEGALKADEANFDEGSERLGAPKGGSFNKSREYGDPSKPAETSDPGTGSPEEGSFPHIYTYVGRGRRDSKDNNASRDRSHRGRRAIEVQKRLEPEKKIGDWEIRDFLELFRNLYKELTGEPYDGESEAKARIRMYRFLDLFQPDVSKQEYRDFIWWVFGGTGPQFEPTLGSIVSKKLFNTYRASKEEKPVETVADSFDDEQGVSDLTEEDLEALEKVFGKEKVDKIRKKKGLPCE